MNKKEISSETKLKVERKAIVNIEEWRLIWKNNVQNFGLELIIASQWRWMNENAMAPKKYPYTDSFRLSAEKVVMIFAIIAKIIDTVKKGAKFFFKIVLYKKTSENNKRTTMIPILVKKRNWEAMY